MIEYLTCGVAVGLIPSVLLGLVCAWNVRLRRELEAAYEELKADLREMTRFRDAEADRASTNSEKIQQLQRELNRVNGSLGRRVREAEDKLSRITSIISDDE